MGLRHYTYYSGTLEIIGDVEENKNLCYWNSSCSMVCECLLLTCRQIKFYLMFWPCKTCTVTILPPEFSLCDCTFIYMTAICVFARRCTICDLDVFFVFEHMHTDICLFVCVCVYRLPWGGWQQGVQTALRQPTTSSSSSRGLSTLSCCVPTWKRALCDSLHTKHCQNRAELTDAMYSFVTKMGIMSSFTWKHCI